jgi:Domain of unknown function (DUF4292)
MSNTFPHRRFLQAGLVLFALFISFGFSACKRKKKQQPPPDQTTENSGNCHIGIRLPKALLNDMRKSEFQFNWLSGKIECEASDDSSKVSFDVTLRMCRDSAIWMIVTDPVIGIKVARVLITKDSVKFVQYLPSEKCFRGDFAYLSQLLQTDVDYDMMQSLLIGNSAAFYEEDEKLKSSVNNDQCNYTLSTIRKRKLRKALETTNPPSDPFQTISLDPNTFKIMKILFVDAQNRNFTANYSEFNKTDSLLFPYQAVFYAKGAQKSARLEMNYKKINLNGPLDFPFTFPDDCQPIILQPNPQQGQH